jgi:D-inositol-3-phosphate glycosyltransferase
MSPPLLRNFNLSRLGTTPARTVGSSLGIGLPAAHPRLEPNGARNADRFGARGPVPRVNIDVALLTGGIDPHYAFGLSTALASKDVSLDVIGSDAIESPEMHATRGLTFLNLQRSKSKANFARRAWEVLAFYLRLLRYTTRTQAKVFHILWNNKLQLFDRTFLMLYHKLLGKKIVLTAHNVNTSKRDGTDTWLNRFTLKTQYRLADHVFVHTEQMKSELLEDFGVRKTAVSVIPYGINNSVPDTSLTPREAKRRLGIKDQQKTLLFFGRIGPYKGLDLLATAFQEIAARNDDYRLVIAGTTKKGGEAYLTEILEEMRDEVSRGLIIPKIQFIPDDDIEIYFKAADAVGLPYTQIYQSGILFLAYSFGVPVIATDVGSFREDILEGETGFISKPGDASHLARTIETYFASDLYKHLDQRRPAIRDYVNRRHSWDVVGEMTRNVYASLLTNKIAHDPHAC